MKIQSLNDSTFEITSQKKKILINPEKNTTESSELALFSSPELEINLEKVDRSFALPGEFETKEVLLKSFFSCSAQENIIWKIKFDGISLLNFGNLNKDHGFNIDKFGELGGDILLITLSNDFDTKLAKKIIDKICPRIVFLNGDDVMKNQAKNDLNAKNSEEESGYEFKSAILSEEKLDIIIL